MYEKCFKSVCFILVVVAGGLNTEYLIANELQGAWKLEAYEVGENKVKATGILLLQDKNFGMIYTMQSGNEGLSVRSHTGYYHIEEDRLFFDVQLWVEDVNEVARIVPRQKVSPLIEINNENLILRFDSGSIQKFSRLSARGATTETGDWQLQHIDVLSDSDSAIGSLVTVGGHFVLVFLQKGQAGWGYGGIYDKKLRQFDVNLKVEFINGTGSISVKDGQSYLSAEYAEPTIKLHDTYGNILEFSQ